MERLELILAAGALIDEKMNIVDEKLEEAIKIINELGRLLPIVKEHGYQRHHAYPNGHSMSYICGDELVALCKILEALREYEVSKAR